MQTKATQISRVAAVFNVHHSKARAIPYNPNWANGTGYFDNAVRGNAAPMLRAGEVVGSEDPKGRKILIMGTPFNNVVVFCRYSNRDDIFALNANSALHNFLSGKVESMLTVENIDYLFGLGESGANIGNVMRDNMAEFKAVAKHHAAVEEDYQL